METLIKSGSRSTVAKLPYSTLAATCLNNTILLVNEKPYIIAEVEIYHYSEDHPDSYCHQHPEQKEFGNWYFHKQGRGGYKGGTFKGVDITLGDSKEHFGILIRSIITSEGKFIEGPCNSVNAIIKECGVSSILELTEGKVISTSHPKLRLVDGPDLKEQIWKGRRVGLSDKYPDYLNREYRFLVYKSLIKRQKTGLREI